MSPAGGARRRSLHQHHPHPQHRRRREGGIRASGDADGRGGDGLRPVDAPPPPRPGGPGVDRPRPVRALGGARKHAALQPPVPDGVRAHPRRPQALPALGQPDAGPPRTRRHPRRRGHHRAPRPGVRERGRDGDRGALARRHLQSARAGHRRPPDLRHRERRRPDGGRRLGSGVARRRPPSRPADRALRREPHHPLRHDQRHLLRRRRGALRGLRLAGAGRRRDGRGRGRRGAHGSPRRRTSALSDRGAHAHRIREPEQARHVRGPRRAARQGRGPADQASVRLAGRRRVPGAGGGAAGIRQGARRAGRRARSAWQQAMDAYRAAQGDLAGAFDRAHGG